MKYRPGWEDGKPVRCRPLRPHARLDACRCRCHCSPAARCPRSPQPYARHVTGDKIVSSIRHVKALPCQRRPSPRPRQPPRRRHHRLRRGLAPPAPPSATLRRWRIGTTEGDAASPPRWRDPGLLRCSPPRAGWQLRRERRPPGNSTVVIASGRGCHHLSVQHPHGLRDEPPTVSPATASVSNDFML